MNGMETEWEAFSIPLADDLCAILCKLGYQKTVLIGHSNGAHISHRVRFYRI